MSVTVVGAGLGPDPQLPDRHALLVDTETVLPTPGPLGRQAGVHVVDPEVHQGGPAGDDLAPGVDEGVREDGHGLHAELQPLVEVLAVEHPAPHVRVLAGDVALVDPVVAAVPVSAALPVLVVALVVRLLPRGSPQQPALVRVGPAGSLIAECLANLAGNSVHLVHIGRAELAGARAVLGQVALVLREPEIILVN